LGVFLFLLLVLVALVAFGLQKKLKTTEVELQKLKQRYGPALDIDRYVKAAESQVAEIRTERQEAEKYLDASRSELAVIEEALRLKADDAHLLEVGYYEPMYGFSDLPRYEKELGKIKEEQKRMLQTQGETGNRAAAAYCTSEMTVNGSRTDGQVLVRRVLTLMLRAFNGECDSFIARVSYRNVTTMEKRVQSAYDQINKVARSWGCELSERYLSNRMDELRLVFEYEEAKQREKEEQARIREQMREEERERLALEKEKEKAIKEKAAIDAMLVKVREEVAKATEAEKAALYARIAELEQQSEGKQRTISQAELTRAGHVYIISNVGSFGDDVYKIGMTRREKPEDRVKELGDASVPFPFDVHALIPTSDAPKLENALHKHFEARRLNLENQRKEFFRVTIEEIRDELELLKDELGLQAELRLTLLAEAKEYRLSEARRKHLERSLAAGNQ